MDTFFRHFDLAAFGNDNVHRRLVSCALGHFLNDLDNIVSLENFAKDNVTAVKPPASSQNMSPTDFAVYSRCNSSSDEELRAIGILACIGHAEETLLGVLQFEVLVSEFFAVDGLATSAIATSEITSLNHEGRDHTMKGRAFIAKALLSGCKSTEVFSCLKPGQSASNAETRFK